MLAKDRFITINLGTMLLSCKLTNSILNYLDHRGEDLSSIIISASLPEEFLRDPSYWMPAAEMEQFLESVQRHPWRQVDGNLLEAMAHSAPEHRSWGVLDSVLRMMPRPEEMLAQPNRFLANFVSPDPPLQRILREEKRIAFDLPISSDQFPLITQFLAWSFETLPVYVGKEMARSVWTGIRLEISWESQQNSMFENLETEPHQVSPELLRQIVASLESHQLELQEKNLDLQKRNEQLLKEQHELEARVTKSEVTAKETRFVGARYHDSLDIECKQAMKQNLSRLMDSFVRAQQLITLLVAQGKETPSVKEAMRRVDWERVKTQYPQVVDNSFALLEKKSEPRSQTHQQENLHV